MPAKSAKQYGLMAGVMSGSIKNSGISSNTAQDFVNNTPAAKRSNFAKNLRKKKKKEI